MPLQHLLHDPVLIILALASLTSWAIIVDRLLALWRARRADGAFSCGGDASTSALAQLRAEVDRCAGVEHERILTVLDTVITQQRARLERMLPLLGVIGSTAPYIGLLGTVIGIIMAFQAIHAQNNLSTSVVADGIATALVATAMGLAVAIPAVAAHHLLTAAINRTAAGWEATVARWLAERKEERHEPLPRA